MTHITTRLILATGVLFVCTSPSFAGGHRYHHHRAAARTYPNEQASYPYYAPGAIIERATERAQHEPGVTNELAPDSRQTATGGPVGGVPGFDGF